MWSRRTAFDRTLNALTRDVRARRDAGAELLDLAGSNPTEANLPYAEDALLNALADPRALHYRPEPFGLPEPRALLAERLALAPAAERIVLTASTSEAYALVFKLLCDPGDEVAIPQPSYPLFEHLAGLEGVRLVPYRLAYDGAWHVDVASLKAALSPKTRAIVVVSPNNPTGSFVKKDELAALGALGVPLVADEVFAEYGFAPDPRRAATARERSDVLTFTMGGLSKSCGLPQMKLAWTCITGPEDVASEAAARLEIVADAYLSASTPIQLALPALLDAGLVTQRAIAARVARNYHALGGALANGHSPATRLHAEGGWTACVRLPQTRSEDEWVRGLLAATGVLVQPGVFYDFAEEPMTVLSLLTPEARFDEGVARLVAYVAANA